MRRKPVAYAPLVHSFVQQCSHDEYVRARRGQRPVSGHFDKRPEHNHKGIDGGVLHLLTHCSQYTPVEDLCHALLRITLLDGQPSVL